MEFDALRIVYTNQKYVVPACRVRKRGWSLFMTQPLFYPI